MTTKEDHEPLTAAARDVARSLTALGAIQRAAHGLRDCKGDKALDAAHEITKHLQSARGCLLGLSASLEDVRNLGKEALPSRNLKDARGALHQLRQRLERLSVCDVSSAMLADVLEALEALGDPVQGSAARGAGEPAPAGGGSAPQEGAAKLLDSFEREVRQVYRDLVAGMELVALGGIHSDALGRARKRLADLDDAMTRAVRAGAVR